MANNDDLESGYAALAAAQTDEDRSYHDAMRERRRRAASDPERGDNVEAWLKNQRDTYPQHSLQWLALDWALDDYRLHADTGTPLDEIAREGNGGY